MGVTTQAWLEAIFFDLRVALRGLRRDRAFSLTGIATLALAVGLNVSVFTVMNAMLFRGYPLVKQNDRLVYLRYRSVPHSIPTTYLDFEAWRAQARAFEGMAFVGGGGPIFVREGPIDMLASRVSANTFALLGVRPALGRDFTPADQLPGAAPVAILNYRFWENGFGKRADIIGETVHINGAPATVIGVMPEGFDFPEQDNLWMPLVRTTEMYQKSFGGYFVLGRLRDGVTLQGARAEIDTINRRLDAADPAKTRSGVSTVFTSSQFGGLDESMIYGSLWAAAWFVLLIACANLANLTLARTMGRWREFATRIALGAGQGRLMRQILLEGLVLASVAGALGWWISTWSVHTWAVATASRHEVHDYTMEAGTLAYLVAISGAATIVFSLAPIGRVMQLGVNGAPRGDARGVTRGLRGKQLAAGLIAGQMALAIVLLSGAGVLVRSLVNVVSADVGVRDPEHVLVGAMRMPSGKYQSPAARLAYFDRLEAQLKTVPGIEKMSVASTIPVNGARGQAFEIEGRQSASDGDDTVGVLTAGSGYFQVVGAPPMSGREFNDDDRMATLPVVVVNQSFVATFWPGEQPLGKHLRVMDRNKQPAAWRVVVGVVPDIMQGDPTRRHFAPLVYIPFRQEPMAARGVNSGNSGFDGAYFLLRSAVPPVQVAPAVRAKAQSVDSDVVLQDFMPMNANFGFRRDQMDLQHVEMGKHAAVAPIFAGVALLLAAIGLYAVVAHSVSQRTKEIGVRMAIGAATKDIRTMIFREGLSPVAIGMALGLAASLGVNRILQSQLVAVSPYDPVTMAAAPAVLIVVALLACEIPARRATSIDPAVALRND